MCKVFHSVMSADLSGLFHLVRDSRNRGHAYKLAIPVCKTELLKRSFGVRRVMLWNSLPAEVVEIESLAVNANYCLAKITEFGVRIQTS